MVKIILTIISGTKFWFMWLLLNSKIVKTLSWQIIKINIVILWLMLTSHYRSWSKSGIKQMTNFAGHAVWRHEHQQTSSWWLPGFNLIHNFLLKGSLPRLQFESSQGPTPTIGLPRPTHPPHYPPQWFSCGRWILLIIPGPLSRSPPPPPPPRKKEGQNITFPNYRDAVPGPDVPVKILQVVLR